MWELIICILSTGVKRVYKCKSMEIYFHLVKTDKSTMSLTHLKAQLYIPQCALLILSLKTVKQFTEGNNNTLLTLVHKSYLF